MIVLVTGCAGFIGSHVTERLSADGHEVHGIDNLLTGRAANLPRRCSFWPTDVCTIGLPAVDTILHAAASYNDPTAWERDIDTNTWGTARVAQHAAETGARVVYLQTSLCYGLQPPPYPVGEDQPLDPHGSYAISKTAGERYLLDSGADIVSFRLANIYGPRNLSGPVPTFYKKLKAGEKCTVVDARRDFVYIDDAVDIFVKAIYGEGSGVYHVSTGGDYSIRGLWEAVADELGGGEADFISRGDDDAATILLDPSKAQEEFGWEASTPFGRGIRKAVAWYDEHGVGDTFTHLKMGAKA